MTRTFAALLVAFALTGCGLFSKAAPTATSSTPAVQATSPAPGPARFLADVRRAGFGQKDMAGAPDSAVLEIGNQVCDGFGAGFSYGRVTSVFDGQAEAAQIDTLTRSAVVNLCPQYTAALPA